ncbi:ArsR family transcriptional regulator [Natrarchaeobius halalkaliphilus]|uniref:ArsR family transcriptional regulator n=1 Tax=Natrarchaeobius halalkaliphilus TaxID=1679091 RepID=A0A3N6LRM7_9EURY|nr:winged helix-turn-helix domain-containing protein [Natrarchaeobius halalkaliphilus]RQG89804.1 ArsR family transcriptional regulator [Natrarchaeobius halalkaliphilus]
MEGFETLRELTRSPVRLDVLRHLLDYGPANATELTDHVDASRRTVSRALDVLENEGLATSNSRTYSATTYAELTASDVFELIEQIESRRDRAAFLNAFPRDAVDVDFETVSGTATRRLSVQPHGPVSNVIDTLTDATSIRVLAPIASPLYVRPFAERVRDGADIEAVVDATAYEEFCGKLHAGIRLAATLADISLAVHDDVGFGLIICDEQVVFGAYEDGILQATFSTAEPAVVNAAKETYQKNRGTATPVIE